MQRVYSSMAGQVMLPLLRVEGHAMVVGSATWRVLLQAERHMVPCLVTSSICHLRGPSQCILVVVFDSFLQNCDCVRSSVHVRFFFHVTAAPKACSILHSALAFLRRHVRLPLHVLSAAP